MAEVTNETLTLPASSRDALTEVLREGARRMLAAAIEAEVAAWIDRRADATDEAGRRGQAGGGRKRRRGRPGPGHDF